MATTVYPAALDTYTTKVNNVDIYDASHINDLQSAVVAIETELGVSPKGSSASVKERIAGIKSAAGVVADVLSVGSPSPYIVTVCTAPSDGFSSLIDVVTHSTTSETVLQLKRSRGTSASPSIVQSGDTAGTISFVGYDGTLYGIAAAVRAFIDGTPGANNVPGRLVFYTALSGTNIERERMRIDNAGTMTLNGNTTNGQTLGIATLTELTTIAAAATTDTAIQIPANAVVFAVSVRVTVAIPTAATFTVTGAASATVFDTAAVSTALNSTDVGTAACPYKNGAAQAIRITPNLTPATNVGRVRVTIHYYQITAPTS